MTYADFAPFARDEGMLTGGMTLYLSTERADYLKGGLCSVNCEAPLFFLSFFLSLRALVFNEIRIYTHRLDV